MTNPNLDDVKDLMDGLIAERQYYIGNDALAYYKVGQSWVLSCSCRYGLIHLASWRWWEPLKQFPKALLAARKVALS